jgi:hypothetical protein
VGVVPGLFEVCSSARMQRAGAALPSMLALHELGRHQAAVTAKYSARTQGPAGIGAAAALHTEGRGQGRGEPRTAGRLTLPTAPWTHH